MIFLNGSTNIDQPCYLLLANSSPVEHINEMNVKHDLEKGSIAVKISVLKRLIHSILSGERVPNVLMTVIRFVLPIQDHTLKKLLLIFWEIIPKTSPDRKLLQEMILVCDAFRKDLQHPNEFIRGATLRYLCKLKEPELLEPLMPSIRQCLEHRHSYVKRNAILAIFAIYKSFEFLIPDAPEVITSFLETNQDAACKRNAFMMLLNVNQNTAFNYLISVLDQVSAFNDSLQLIIVESVYKICLENPTERPRFLRCIYSLLNSNNPSVRYEAAGTLVTLSNAPTAIKASISCYIDLALKESDNNVKLIVLHQLSALKLNLLHEKVLQELVMDILHILASSDMEVRRKTLQLVSGLITKRNINDVVVLLKKEVTKTLNFDCDETGKYRKLLVQTLHACSLKFPEIVAIVIPILIEFLTDANEKSAANDVVNFILDSVHKYENLRRLVIKKLLGVFTSIKNASVHQSVLWILGEYTASAKDIENFMEQLRIVLGKMPLIDAERELNGKESEKMIEIPLQQPLITSDGSYASQSVFNVTKIQKENTRPTFRQYFMDGDYFIGVTLGMTLVKLVFKYGNCFEKNDGFEHKINQLVAEVLLILSSIIHFGKSGISSKLMSNDDFDHILMCIKIVSVQLHEIVDIFLNHFRKAFDDVLFIKNDNTDSSHSIEKICIDQAIKFDQLMKSVNLELLERINVFETSLNQAIVGDKFSKSLHPSNKDSSNKLNKVTQLTGFSDPVYAEAYVHVNEYDILLDVLIVNQTDDVLQNCTLELATVGDLKLVEKPMPILLAAKDFSSIQASVKVTSTENGIIFGNIVYDVCGTHLDSNVVILNDIHIDIMDYIVPAQCTDSDFRNMWAEFEWENKISVVTRITNLNLYLEYLLKNTNMRCLTSEKALSGDCGFLAANLYAKSIFGEHALANVCVEKPINNLSAPVTGHVRIRAKTQGMALSLGDKINIMQKTLHKKHPNVNSLTNSKMMVA